MFIVKMTDEQDGLDASLVKRKLTKRERLRGVVQRGVGKVKKSDEESTRDGEFTLNDDARDFLAFRSPYSKPAAVQSSPPPSQKPDTKPTTAPPPLKQDVDDPSDVLPHFPTPSRDPLSVPRIDVAKSPHFPQARDLLVENDEADMVSSLRIQDDPESPPKRKTRRKGLAVRFSDSPPIIIGEGGDDAEAPTMSLMHTRARARSDASMPEPQQHQGQFPSSPILRKPVGSPAYNASPQYILPQSLQSMEFDMTLTPGLGHTSMPIQSTSLEVPEAPAARTQRLKMRAEEGKTLRQSFHDASLSSSFD
jgi:hypothetical protein